MISLTRIVLTDYMMIIVTMIMIFLTDDKSSSLKASAAVGALLPGVRLLRQILACYNTTAANTKTKTKTGVRLSPMISTEKMMMMMAGTVMRVQAWRSWPR